MLLICVGSVSTVLLLLELSCLQANATACKRDWKSRFQARMRMAAWPLGISLSWGAFSVIPSIGGSCLCLATVDNNKLRLKSGNSKKLLLNKTICFAPDGGECAELWEQARAELEHGSFSDVWKVCECWKGAGEQCLGTKWWLKYSHKQWNTKRGKSGFCRLLLRLKYSQMCWVLFGSHLMKIRVYS